MLHSVFAILNKLLYFENVLLVENTDTIKGFYPILKFLLQTIRSIWVQFSPTEAAENRTQIVISIPKLLDKKIL